MRVEVFFDNEDRKPDDLVGFVEYEDYVCGIVDNYPRRKTVPFYNFDIYAGNDKTYRVYVKDKDLNTINLTGATVVMTWRKTKDGSNIIQKSTANPSEGAITDPTHGEAMIYIVPPDTTSLEIRQYVFDVTVTVASGKVYTIAEGVINLLEPVNN
jgi:hypothetical protein